MKRVLILAYDFPPYNSIGGQRPYSWYRYFREFGIEPIVLTRHWDRPIKSPEDCYLPSIERDFGVEESDFGKIIRVPFNPNLRDRLIQRSGAVNGILRKVLSLLQYTCEHSKNSSFDDKREIYERARVILRDENIDAIIATGEPFVLFSYASQLSQEFGVTWIADYRDGWSTNFNNEGKVQHFLRSYWIESIEKRVVSTASLVTTAAPVFSEQIASLLNLNRNQISVIYNGYFEEKFAEIRNIERKRIFTIGHAGTVYPFQRVETFMEGLNQFYENHPEKEVHVYFYGLKFQPAQMERIRSLIGNAHAHFTDRMSHEEMLKELGSLHVQLLLATPEKHQIYAKVFDYLATGRPILMVENDKGPLEEILSKRKNASICSSPSEVKAYLEEIFNDENILASTENEDDTFTRRNQTKRFAELILETIENSKRK